MTQITRSSMDEAADNTAELNRLRAINADLLAAAKGLLAEYENPVSDVALRIQYRQNLRAAIVKAEENL